MNHDEEKIVVRCKKCNNRMFDYVSGDLHIEMKCCKCKRVMVLKNYTEKVIRTKTINGVLSI